MINVPFNRANLMGRELDYIRESLESTQISGDGPFTHRCHEALEAIYGGTVLLMHSCTAALEAAVILADIKPGDEVIMPSFTFVSTANAVVLRGGIPVFVDIREDTLNIDESLIEAAITSRTRAIMPVHYAGVSTAMDEILALGQANNLEVIEDAAQGFGALYKDSPLGSLGTIGCISFHETKNMVSGEGGAIIINKPALAQRAQFIREKGTNRTQFLRREVMKYEWVDIGSSFLPSDLLAAVLLAQLERAAEITSRRHELWERYHIGLQSLRKYGFVLPVVPPQIKHNGHIFFFQAASAGHQQRMLRALKEDGIGASSHYVPLHNSPAGLKYARVHGELNITERAAATLIRLPMHTLLSDEQVDFTIDRVLYHAQNLD